MKQMMVVSEDKPGLLADISYLLGKAKINMENISVDVVGGKAIIHIFVKDEDKAKKILSANGYEVLTHENLILRLDNQPGEWAKVAALLKKEGININDVKLITKGMKYHIYSLSTDKNKKAERLLTDYLWFEDVL